MSDHFPDDEDYAPHLTPGANDSAAHPFDSVRPRLHVVSNSNYVDDDVDDEELEARLDGTHGRSIAQFTPFGNPAGRKLRSISSYGESDLSPRGGDRVSQPGRPLPGIKRRTPKQIREDMPPTPRGCEWRRSDEGWNLWRYWSEPDESGKARIKMTRYTGHLSHDAWQIMKEYNHETFLSIVGQRLRRHGRG
ncbi:MAG: hypothetical protein ACREEM_37705 [Blastocatellia bacterium]